MARVYDLVKDLPDNMEFIDCSAIGHEILTTKQIKERHVNDLGNSYYLSKAKFNYGKIEKISIRTGVYGLYNQV